MTGADQARASGAGALAFGRPLVLATVLLLFLIDGVHMQLLATSIPSMAKDFGAPPGRFALALALGHGGAAVGAAAGGRLGDRLGRRATIIGGTLLFGIASLAQAFATGVDQIATLRTIAGLGLGGCVPPAMTLLTECFPERRSYVVALAVLCAPLGISAAGLLATAVIPAHGWRGLFLLGGALPVGLAALMRCALPPGQIDPDLLERRADQGPAQGRRRGVRDLDMAAGFVRPATWLCASFFLTYVAMSGVLGWLPSLLTGAGFAISTANAAASGWSAGGLVGVLCAGWAAAALGWRAALITFTACSLAGMAALIGISPGQGVRGGTLLVFDAALVATGACLNGLITALYAAATVIFPATIRSTGVGLAASAGRAGSIGGAYVGGAIVAHAGVRGFFEFTAGLLALVLLAVLFTANPGRARRAGAQCNLQPGS